MEREENNIEDDGFMLARTNNGEWISAIHIEILSEFNFRLIQSLAEMEEKILEKHYGYYETGELFIWCYKSDVSDYKSFLEENNVWY